MNVPTGQEVDQPYKFESAMHPSIEATVGDVFSLANTILQKVAPPTLVERVGVGVSGTSPAQYYARRFQLEYDGRSHRLAQITDPGIYPYMGDWDRILVESRILDGNSTLMSMSRNRASFGSFFQLDQAKASGDIADVEGVLRGIKSDLAMWLSSIDDSAFLRQFYRVDGVVQAVSSRYFPWIG